MNTKADVALQTQLMTEGAMVTKAGIIPIYPTGRGRYVLGSPDGEVLLPGFPLTVLVAGHKVEGTVRASEQGDYLQLTDGSCCGLCACMRVVNVVSQEQKREVVR